MCRAVVLDGEPVLGVVEVDPAQKRGCIAEGHLDFRTRQAGEHQEQAQPGLHWARGSGLGKVDDLAQPRARAHVFQSNHLLVQRRVQHDHCLHKIQANAEVDHGPNRRSHWHAFTHTDLIRGETTSLDVDSDAPRDARRRRNCRLDYSAARVETVKERGSGSGEDSALWQTAHCGSHPLQRVLGQALVHVKVSAYPTPACSPQMVLGQSMPARFGNPEGSLHQGGRNQGNPAHPTMLRARRPHENSAC